MSHSLRLRKPGVGTIIGIHMVPVSSEDSWHVTRYLDIGPSSSKDCRQCEETAMGEVLFMVRDLVQIRSLVRGVEGSLAAEMVGKILEGLASF
jgi:hypothetical protein